SEQGVSYDLFSVWTARHKQLADRVHCDCSLSALLQNMPFAWAGLLRMADFLQHLGCWRESCKQRAGWSRAHAHYQITTRVGVEPPPKRSMIIFGATTPKLMARIIASAVMASAMVARRRSK